MCRPEPGPGSCRREFVSFAAEPASIQPGQSVTLVWHAENPSGTTIEPELGRVTPRGSRQVTPKATTTYTLTVRGVNNQVLTRSVTVNVAGTVPVAVAAPSGDAKKPVPRTADGKPDFSGVYTGLGGGGAGRGAAPGAAPAGPVLKAGAEKFRARARAGIYRSDVELHAAHPTPVLGRAL